MARSCLFSTPRGVERARARDRGRPGARRGTSTATCTGESYPRTPAHFTGSTSPPPPPSSPHGRVPLRSRWRAAHRGAEGGGEGGWPRAAVGCSLEPSPPLLPGCSAPRRPSGLQRSAGLGRGCKGRSCPCAVFFCASKLLAVSTGPKELEGSLKSKWASKLRSSLSPFPTPPPPSAPGPMAGWAAGLFARVVHWGLWLYRWTDPLPRGPRPRLPPRPLCLAPYFVAAPRRGSGGCSTATTPMGRCGSP